MVLETSSSSKVALLLSLWQLDGVLKWPDTGMGRGQERTGTSSMWWKGAHVRFGER